MTQRQQAELVGSLDKRVQTLRDREAGMREQGKAYEQRLARQAERLGRQAARMEELEKALSRCPGTRLRAWLGRLGSGSL